MRWVRVRAEFPRYAGGGPAPSFDITSDDDGFANVEVAVRPEQLVAPISSNPPEFFSSAAGSAEPSVAAATVRIVNGRATYDLPEAMWSIFARSTPVLWYRVVASTQAAGTPVVASHGDEDCLRGIAGSIEVPQMIGPVPAGPVTIPPPALEKVPDRRRRVLQGIVDVPGTADRRLLAEVVAHPAFVAAPSDQQAGVLDLFARSNTPGREMVEQLLDGGVEVGSKLVESRLFVRDERNEGTTLDHLLALHDARFHRRVRASRAEIVAEAMRELVDPGLQINQGDAETCTVTSVMAYAVVRNPAEVARWFRHLFDANSRHRCTLAKGGVLRLNTRAFSATSWEPFLLRSYTERVVQAALMDFGNFRQRYDPQKDSFIDWAGKAVGSGLWEFEMTHIVENAFNQPVRWDFGGGTRSAPNRVAAADALVAHLRNGGLPVILVTRWGTNGAHATVALRVEGNDVIIRNPQYRGAHPAKPDGTPQANPPRRILRAHRAEEAIAHADLRTWIIGYCAESGSSTDFGYTAAEIPSHLQSAVTPTAA
jgi:hypothetical protein